MILNPFIPIEKNSSIVFDVGANSGSKVYEFLEWGAKVIAFEPQPECISYLQNTYGSNPNLTIVQKAISNVQGQQELSICTQVNTLSTMSTKWHTGRFRNYAWDKKLVVDCITLDDAVATYGKPVFIKIDVEGFEYQVVKSLSQPVYALSFEYSSEFIDDVTTITDYLLKLGFSSFNFSVGDYFPFLPENVNFDKLMAELTIKKTTHPNPDLWGNIYAYYSQ